MNYITGPIADAMWGDPDDLPLCECCCSEHTFSSCPARAIGTCRGQNTLTTQDLEGWAKHYGMELSEFLCYEPPVPPDYTAPAPEPRSFDDIWDEVQENYEYNPDRAMQRGILYPRR